MAFSLSFGDISQDPNFKLLYQQKSSTPWAERAVTYLDERMNQVGYHAPIFDINRDYAVVFRSGDRGIVYGDPVYEGSATALAKQLSGGIIDLDKERPKLLAIGNGLASMASQYENKQQTNQINKQGGASIPVAKAEITKTPKGYAYTDKYGFSHVVSDYNTAKQYAAPSTGVYSYTGNYSGGYARDSTGNRLAVPTPGAIPYGNDLDKGGTKWATSGLGSLVTSPAYSQPLTGSPVVTVVAGAQLQPWEQKLQQYKTDKSAALTELQRARDVYASERDAYNKIYGPGAFEQTSRAKEISHWADQIREAAQLDNTLFGASVPQDIFRQNVANYTSILNPPVIEPVQPYQVLPPELMQILQPQPMPTYKEFSIEDFINEAMKTRQPAIDTYAKGQREEYYNRILPDLRAQEAAAGFLHSDTRFNRENQALQTLNEAIDKFAKEQYAEATSDAYKMAQLANQQQQIMMDAWKNQETLRQANLGLLSQLFGNIFGIPTLAGKEFDLKQQELGLKGRQVDLEAQRVALEQQRLAIEQALNTVRYMGFVPNEQVANILGVPVGTPSWEAENAAADRLNRLEIARIQASAARSGSSGGLTAAQALQYQLAVQDALGKDADKLEKAFRDEMNKTDLYQARDKLLQQIDLNEKAGRFNAYGPGYANSLRTIVNGLADEEYQKLIGSQSTGSSIGNSAWATPINDALYFWTQPLSWLWGGMPSDRYGGR